MRAMRKAVTVELASSVQRQPITRCENASSTADTYVPGIGLMAFSYSHHGTVSEVKMNRVEIRVPGQLTL